MTPPDGPDREVPCRDPLAPPGQLEPAGGPLPPQLAEIEPEFRPDYKLPVGSVLGDSLGAYFGSFIQYSLLASIALLPVIVWAAVVFTAIGAVAAALVFYHLKINLEGSDADELASVFD